MIELRDAVVVIPLEEAMKVKGRLLREHHINVTVLDEYDKDYEPIMLYLKDAQDLGIIAKK